MYLKNKTSILSVHLCKKSKRDNNEGEVMSNFFSSVRSPIDANEKSAVKGKKPWISINIGNVYFQEEDWLSAKEKYFDALDAFRRRNVSHPNTLSGKTVALSNLGRIEMNLNNYD